MSIEVLSLATRISLWIARCSRVFILPSRDFCNSIKLLRSNALLDICDPLFHISFFRHFLLLLFMSSSDLLTRDLTSVQFIRLLSLNSLLKLDMLKLRDLHDFAIWNNILNMVILCL